MKAEAELNLAFMYFLGLNLEDSLPDKSLLSKFRTQRLGENTLDEMMSEMYGEIAYFRKSILDDILSLKANPYIPVSSLVCRLDESQFTYNKDTDEWQCNQGNITEKKKYFRMNGKDGGREGYKYYFGLAM